jgi:hypothetical protein
MYNIFLCSNLNATPIYDPKCQAQSFVFSDSRSLCMNNDVDVKWRKNDALLLRSKGSQNKLGEGAKTGVLSHEAKWLKWERGR